MSEVLAFISTAFAVVNYFTATRVFIVMFVFGLRQIHHPGP